MRTKQTTRAVVTALLGCVLTAALAGVPATAWATKTRIETTSNPAYEQALAELETIASSHDALAAEQDATLGKLEDVRSQIKQNEQAATKTQADIEVRKEELARKQAALGEQVANDYKTGGVSLLSILLSSTSIEDAVSRIYYHAVVCSAEMEQIDDVNAARTALQKKQDELSAIHVELTAQEQSVQELLEQQRNQTEELYQQQLQAAELVSSLPRELQVVIEEEEAELVNESEAMIHANEEAEQQEDETPATDPQPETNDDAEVDEDESPAQDEDPATEDTNEDKQEKPAQDKQDTKPTKPKNETPSDDDAGDDTKDKDPAPTTPSSDGSLQALIDSAYATGATRRDWGCSGWVYIVFKNAGISNFSGSAAQFYSAWCTSSDRNALQPGMVIAVNNTGGSAAGRMYGHVGIYLGNNTVRHYTGGVVQEASLDGWIRSYGRVCTPRWGWNGGVALS
jgi:peptidoglycan hydrolase CwlO-like protein